MPGARAAARSRRIVGLARRLGVEPPNPRPVAPAWPVGVKLELTYACNLRCGFCYTDSPRRTLERAVDLSDEDWRAIVAEVVGLGVIEAVITGGEPLLRKELALELFERLDGAGVGVTFNTNGWFLDAAAADRLARASSVVNVHVSLDGATPELHDAARGVPGSWRRAVAALGLLADRGVPTHIVHVLTPQNERWVEQLIEQAWLLGASSLALTPVSPVGAAARPGAADRFGGWRVNERRLRRIAARAASSYEPEMRTTVAPEVQTFGPVRAPAYLVVRPNGAVVPGSLSPFRFGHARRDGLAACWRRIARDWDHEHVRAWREPILRGKPIDEQDLVIYRDEEQDIDEPVGRRRPDGPPVALPHIAEVGARPGDLDAAGRHVRQIALARRYRLGPIRFNHDPADGRYVRGCSDGRVSKLNPTAAAIMDACAPGAAAAAVSRLQDRGAVAGRDLERDVLDTVRRLVYRGILCPAACPEPPAAVAGPPAATA